MIRFYAPLFAPTATPQPSTNGFGMSCCTNETLLGNSTSAMGPDQHNAATELPYSQVWSAWSNAGGPLIYLCLLNGSCHLPAESSRNAETKINQRASSIAPSSDQLPEQCHWPLII